MKLPIVKPLRLLNVILSLTIFVVLFINRDRFIAMLHPKAKEAVGIPAPDIDGGVWINSTPLSLYQLRGKVVVIDFWSFKCDNCLHVLPTLRDWYKRYNDKGVVFIGVHTPETNEEKNVLSLQRFVGAHGIEFPVVTDNSYATWNLYHVQFWPSTFIIDRQGVIRKFHYGELGFSLLEDDIKRLLGS